MMVSGNRHRFAGIAVGRRVAGVRSIPWAARLQFRSQKPALVVFCGLPGAGKSTLADNVAQRLREAGFAVTDRRDFLSWHRTHITTTKPRRAVHQLRAAFIPFLRIANLVLWMGMRYPSISGLRLMKLMTALTTLRAWIAAVRMTNTDVVVLCETIDHHVADFLVGLDPSIHGRITGAVYRTFFARLDVAFVYVDTPSSAAAGRIYHKPDGRDWAYGRGFVEINRYLDARSGFYMSLYTNILNSQPSRVCRLSGLACVEENTRAVLAYTARLGSKFHDDRTS